MEPLSALEGVKWFAYGKRSNKGDWVAKHVANIELIKQTNGKPTPSSLDGVVVAAAAGENWFRAESVLFEYTVFQPLVPGAQAWAAAVSNVMSVWVDNCIRAVWLPFTFTYSAWLREGVFPKTEKNSKFLTDICVHIIKPEWDGSIVTVPTTRCLRAPGATVSTTDLFAGQMHTSYACSIDSVWGLKTAAERW